MFLLKLKIFSLPEVQSVFRTEKEARDYVNSISLDSLENWSLHPLFVQSPIDTFSHKSNTTFTVSVQNSGDPHPHPLAHNITADCVYDLILKDMDFKPVRKIILFPD